MFVISVQIQKGNWFCVTEMYMSEFSAAWNNSADTEPLVCYSIFAYALNWAINKKWNQKDLTETTYQS